MNKTIVMFDMDGTLTEPRQAFDPSVLGAPLFYLSEVAEIGIVTGSDENYLTEQMRSLLEKSSCRYKTHLLPCNGTKYYPPPQTADDFHKLSSQESMRDKLGSHYFHNLIKEIMTHQCEISNHPIPLTGHFINYRDSMINWCPIGRNANNKQRKEFQNLDKNLNLRRIYKEKLENSITTIGLKDLITIKMGGETSFDIFPNGWNKTYALNRFEGWDVWFVGDRCSETGNDYELYKHCGQQGFETSGPEQTKEIILEKIIPTIKSRRVSNE